MSQLDDYLISNDGTKLRFQRWESENVSCGNVVILHGLGGHSGQSTYTYLISHLVSKCYHVYGLDLRGHGKSGGRRGTISKWSEYRDDLRVFLLKIKENDPSNEIYVIGQSLGGLIALEFAIRYPDVLKGVIVSAPALAEPDISPVLRILLQILSPIAPHLSLNSNLDLSGVSRDPIEVEKLIADPLSDPKLSPRLATELLSALRWTHKHAGDLKVPSLIIHGTADPITPSIGSQTFFDNITIADKTLKMYQGGYHQSFIDINRSQVLEDVSTWLAAH